MSEQKHEQQVAQELLSNQAFLRLARGFETYQELLWEAKDEKERNQIKERMRKIYKQRAELPDEPEMRKVFDEFKRIFGDIFDLCEDKKSFTAEKLAEKLAGSLVGRKLLEMWNPRPGKEQGGNKQIPVNEVVAYRFDPADSPYLNLNIIPTSLRSAELLGKVLEGFSLLAKEMKTGKMQGVKKISMVSWLLGKNFEEKLKIIFGDLIDNIVELDENEREAEEGVSFLAIHYNRRSLVDYLKTGKFPQIRKLVMTKEEFLNIFLNE